MTHNFVINTRLGNFDQTTSKLNHHPKRLNPTETYLFVLFLQHMLTNIDIWVSGLEHRERFKAVIRNINTLCNPSLFAIPQELLAPCHNFSVYSGWYNQCSYAWVHRSVPTNTHSRYHFLGSYSTVIEMSTQRHIDFHKSVVAFPKHHLGRNFIRPIFQIEHYGSLHFPSCCT